MDGGRDSAASDAEGTRFAQVLSELCDGRRELSAIPLFGANVLERQVAFRSSVGSPPRHHAGACHRLDLCLRTIWPEERDTPPLGPARQVCRVRSWQLPIPFCFDVGVMVHSGKVQCPVPHACPFSSSSLDQSGDQSRRWHRCCRPLATRLGAGLSRLRGVSDRRVSVRRCLRWC